MTRTIFLLVAMSVGMLAQLHNPVSSEGKKQELEKIAERAANPPVIYDEPAAKKKIVAPPQENMHCATGQFYVWHKEGIWCETDKYFCPSVKGYRTFKLQDDSGEMRCLHIPKSTKE